MVEQSWPDKESSVAFARQPLSPVEHQLRTLGDAGIDKFNYPSPVCGGDEWTHVYTIGIPSADAECCRAGNHSRHYRIGEGTSEVHRMVIARDLLK